MRNFSFQKQILYGFILCVLFVLILAIVSYFSLNKMQTDVAWVNHTAEVINKASLIQTNIVTAESEERAFLSTGADSDLIAFKHASDMVTPSVSELKILVQDNPSQTGKVNMLEIDIRQKLKQIEMAATARQHNAQLSQSTQAQGDILTDKIRDQINNIISTEKSLWEKRKQTSESSVNNSIIIILLGCLITLILVLVLFNYIRKTFWEQKIIEENLEQVSRENKDRSWLLTGSANLGQAVREEHEAPVFKVDILLTRILNELAQYLNAQVGAIYIADDSGKTLRFEAGYAFQPPRGTMPVFNLGEGLVGQAALDHKAIVFNDIADEHLKIISGTGSSSPKSILVQPLYAQGELKGVIELGFANGVSDIALEFIDRLKEIIGVEISTGQAKVRSQQLFEQIQLQAEELESQQEELRTTNDELVHKTLQLETSEEELRVQQEELQEMNSELKEKAELLEEKNKAVDEARKAIALKIVELEKTSKYKSEFLANMSHELRTPLNSILILAGILKTNKHDNLSEEQVKYASVIHNAGNDLLTLINDILDLSKIESGKVDLTIEEVNAAEIRQDIELLFKEVANNKKISFSYTVESDVPKKLVSDRVRLEQILKNLLSNAFKFTPESGKVSIDISLAKAGRQFYSDNLRTYSKPVLAFAVKDTGIGIPESKQKAIFEAFQQADGSTSRNYGGTGLGLSISKELAKILGGEIDIESREGEGSTFTLFVPLSYDERQIRPEDKPELSADLFKPSEKTGTNILKAPDDNKDHFLLIIEDDENFADILKDYAIERGFTPLLAHTGTKGLEMALERQPGAILLDIMLPEIDGWQILKKLKDDQRTKNIPIHLMSAGDENPDGGKKEGAIGFLKKPVDKEKLDEAFDLLIQNNQFKLSKVLIIEDHKIQSKHLKDQLISQNIEVKQAFDGAEALKILADEKDFDCIILDLNLPDITGLDLLDKIKADKALSDIPVVINTAMELDADSMSRVMKHTQAMVLKNKKSNFRLLDEVNLFLNKIKTGSQNKPSRTTQPLQGSKNLSTQEKALKNKLVLIVDDDMRNIFALTSALQNYDLRIEIANNGNEALHKLDEQPEIDIVLMDIMMPEKDGYETMRDIRAQKRFSKLPIIALTAKAMKNDREKCIEAGADDYIPKPVDMEKLLSMMRVWLSQGT